MLNTERLHFLDNLRASVIALVIILHGSISYMEKVPEWWLVINPQKSIFFTILVILFDVSIMQILFFVAGYFALPSRAKRNGIAYLKNKFIRIGAPWIVGVIFFAPLITYMYYIARSVPMKFFHFWTTVFWTERFSHSHFWFLGILFFFYCILGILYSYSKWMQSLTRQISFPGKRFFILFLLILSTGMLIINQFFPFDSWYIHAYILVFQPLRIFMYTGYFLLGIYAYTNSWFTKNGYRPNLAFWAILWFITNLAYFYSKLFFPASPDLTVKSQITYFLHAFLINANCLFTLMVVTALYQNYINIKNWFWKNMIKNSFGIYYVHSFFLYPVVYLLIPVSLSIFFKVLLVIILTLLLSWLFTLLVLRKIPLIRRSFN